MLSILKTRFKSALIPAVILLVAIAIFAYFKATKPAQPPVQIQQKMWPVKVMPITLESLSAVQTLFGRVESQLVKAASPVNGVVAKVLVQEGTEIKKGDLLVALSKSDLDLPYQMAKADVDDMTAQLTLEKLAYTANKKRLVQENRVLSLKLEDVARNQKLIKKNLSSQTVLDSAREALVRQEFVVIGSELSVAQYDAKLAQLNAKVMKAKASLAIARLNKQRGRVVAPYDGRIASVNVRVGERVSLGALLVSYYATDTLEVRAKVPVPQLKNVLSGLASSTELFATYILHEQTYYLPLARLAGESSPSGIDAFFTLPAALKTTWPGDLMSISLHGEQQHNVFSAPYSALYGTSRIYLEKDGKLQAVRVQNLGEVRVNNQMQVILQGAVSKNDSLLVTQLPNAMTGLRVSVKTLAE